MNVNIGDAIVVLVQKRMGVNAPARTFQQLMENCLGDLNLNW